MRPIILLLGLLAAYNAFSANSEHSTHYDGMHQQASKQTPTLTEAGNDIFGTIQEVITTLNADPDTNWKQVNIPALRKHLLDMREMTVNVEVVSQKSLKNGLEILISPRGKRAQEAMKRVLAGHPMQLKQETGWTMQIQKQGLNYLLTTTSKNLKEADKIIALGYIGLMAYGNHHQPHHFSMAIGNNPHAH